MRVGVELGVFVKEGGDVWACECGCEWVWQCVQYAVLV